MGGNDPVLSIGVEESVQNISKIVGKTINSGAKVVWCNSTPAGVSSRKNSEYKPYVKVCMEMLTMKGLIKIDMFSIYQKFPTSRFFTFTSEENPVEGVKEGEPDLQHPNQLGNAYITKVMLDNVFGIPFDPEKYIVQTLKGIKYPQY